MKGMEKISEAILDKVRAEAQGIIKEAEEKARERVDKAKSQQAARLEAEKTRLVAAAQEEATRILAQAAISSRQELLLARTEIIEEIISGVKKTLSKRSDDGGSLKRLIEEAVATLDIDEARIYVSHKDKDVVAKAVKGDKKLAARIKEIKDYECIGGVMVEDMAGRIRIDNTYDTRLEMLLPKLLPELGKELFEGQ